MKKIRAQKMEIFGFFVLVLLCIGLAGNFSPQVKASPDFVTETFDSITIENSYFKTIVWKKPVDKHGHIRYFYIKPQDTINIVATTAWKFLGGHEAHSKWGTTTKAGVDWNAGEKLSQTTQIIEQTSSHVVIENIRRFKSGSTHYPYTAVDYLTFFSDKLYYIVSSTRTFHEQAQYLDNDEICFLYHYRWANRYYQLLHDGSILNYSGMSEQQEVVGVWETRNLQKYPWVMMFNDTYGLGHFTILVSANPPTIGIGYSSYNEANGYHEYQILFPEYAVEVGESHYVTYISGVSQNTTYVNNLSASLWSSTVYQPETFTHRVASNNQSSDNIKLYSTPFSGTLRYHTTFTTLGDYSYPVAHPKERVWFYPEYINSSGTYNVQLTSPTVTQEWNGTYTKITRQKDYQSKIRLTIDYESWNDSDPYRITWNFTTLTTLNVTEFRVRMYGWAQTIDGCTITSLSNSIVKMNKTKEVSENYQIPEQAVTFKNTTTLNATTETGYSGGIAHVYWYALKFDSQQEIASGNSYIVQLLIQRHIRFNFENRATFGLNDVLDIHETQNNRFEKLCWAKFPFFDTSTPFRINHYGAKNSQIYGVKWTSYDLSFSVVAPYGNTSITKIYVGNKGEPKEVWGATSWSYNASTTILTLNVVHNGPANILVDWRIPGDVNGDGLVDIHDLARIGKAYGSTPGTSKWDPDCDIRKDDIIDIYDLKECGKNYGKKI